MSTSQLVTVAGINKVWTATKALYNKLDHRLDNIGRLYTPKGTVAAFDDTSAESDLLSKTGVKVGDTWVVSDGYPVFTDDPENFPASTSYSGSVPPRPFICIKDYNGRTSIQNGSTWQDYWNPINLNLNIASDNNYGIVKTGGVASSSEIPVKINNNGNIYFEMPDVGGYSHTSTNNNKLKISSDLQTYEVHTDTKQGLAINDGDNFTDNLRSGTIKLDAVQSIGTVGNNYFEYLQSTGNSNVKVTLNGAFTNDISGGKGGASKPIYITSGGAASPIEKLHLSIANSERNDYLATFESGTAAGTNQRRTVEITGYGTSDSADPTSSSDSNINVALHVNGAARVTGAFSAGKVYHAVWNDISDAIEVQDTLKTDPGYCYFFDGKEYHRTDKYCQKGIIGIHSDTAGSVLGRKGKHKELDISVGGFVLAYVDKEYAPGTPLTSAPNGRLTKMGLISRILHPERLVATYWKKETNKEWGDETHKVEVNGRHWVKVR